MSERKLSLKEFFDKFIADDFTNKAAEKEKVEDEDCCNPISKCSIAIEHVKYDLAEELQKDTLLSLTNMALINELNLYSATMILLSKKQSADELLKELAIAYKNSLKTLELIFKDISEETDE